jgi:hypothetical protein
MAQKRKRRTKHRGNAAGVIEARGRTGRPPTAAERKQQSREQSRQARMNKMPTWKSSFNRGALAAAFMFLFLLLLGHSTFAGAIVFALFALALYVPSGYYLELYFWRRRQRKGLVR